jgi:hypothetical protein
MEERPRDGVHAVRPAYETASDQRNETEVISLVCRIWRCLARKAPKFYQNDYFLVRGDDVVAVVEIKCRENAHDKYSTYMLSAHKWMHGVAWEGSLKVPFLLVVQFTDGLYYCRPKECKRLVRIGGRVDRNDRADIEPVVHIPMDEFKPMYGSRQP